MADWLIVRLARSPDEAASCVVTDADGQLRTDVQYGSLETFFPAAAGRRVCAIVPGVDVLQTSAELPGRSASRTPQIVAFALEEQVAADIEGLHFALGKPHPGATQTPVDVVARALMDEWLARLKAAGLVPEAMYADSELLPQHPEQLTALLEDDSIAIRSESRTPLVLPVDDLQAAFDLTAVPTSTSVTQPLAEIAGELVPEAGDKSRTHLVVYAGPVDWQRQSHSVEALRERFASLKVQLLTGGVLPFLAQQIGAGGAVNLLQGSYAPVKSGNSGLLRWRFAAALAGALIVLHLLGRTIELNRLAKVERQLDTTITEVFRSAMPGEQNATDARRRMQKRLEGLSASRTDGGGLLALLSAVASARSASPGATLETLSFRDDALDLKVIASDAESLERINQALRGGGLQAEIAAGNQRGNSYEGRLQVKAGI